MHHFILLHSYALLCVEPSHKASLKFTKVFGCDVTKCQKVCEKCCKIVFGSFHFHLFILNRLSSREQ